MAAWIYIFLIAAAVPEESVSQSPITPAAVRAKTASASALRTADSAAEAGRPPKKLRADIHGALRAAATQSGPAHDAAVRRLAALYVELSHDTQLPLDERLILGRTIRARLLKIKEQISRGRNRSRQDASELSGDGRAELTSSGSRSVLPSSGSQAVGAAGGAAGPSDEGEALVDLIQRTIAPGTWDINGGLGTIRYYSPLHALVVRQTDEGHDLVGGVLNGLRD